MNSFSLCVEEDAQANPNKVCIETITEYGQFAMFSKQTKADVCTKTVSKYEALNAQALAAGGYSVNACSTIIVQLYTDYQDYLNELQEKIVSNLIDEMNQQISKVQGTDELTKETDEV